MGLDFLREKAKSFTQQRDASKIKELDIDDLISRGREDIIIRVFQCVLTDLSAKLEIGTALILKVESEDQISVLQSGRKIGHVLSEEIAELIHAMKQNNHLGGLLSVFAQSKPALDGVFTVRPKTAFKDH